MSDTEINLTVLITVVSGSESLRRCLETLRKQINWSDSEIVVPYDKWSMEIEDLIDDFPGVRFHYINELGRASSDRIASHSHRLFDRRRAVGLALARGRLIAMTEDHALPASDWCRQIVEAHLLPYAVIGGAIDNQVDRPLNWALYYCDFGRYGRPLRAGEAKYASDVNLSYKRSALESVRNVWSEAYHETNVNWTLRAAGEVIFLDPRIVVEQHRPSISLGAALKERFQWGRIFAETRSSECSPFGRMLYVLGTPLLPALLLGRLVRHMVRQRRTLKQVAMTIPLAVVLLTAWSLGELAGYMAGEASASDELTSPEKPLGEGRY